MIEIIRKAYNGNRINDDEMLTLLDLLKDTAEYKLKDYPQIWKGVNDMLNREYMPKWKIDLEEALEKNEKDVTGKVTVKVTSATEIEMLINERKWHS